MLNGLRVVDLTRVLAGPLCTMTLGDLGADVIKIEHPDGGDETRGWGPPFDARRESAYYLSVNRNKLDIALDLNTPADLDLLRRLIAGADIVVDNFRRGMLESRGIRAEELLSTHTRLIWCTLTGFGAESDRPGYDFVVQAECGWMSVTGEVSGEPMKSGIALADVIAGKDTTIAILAALAARDRLDVGGRRLIVSLAHSATAALVNVAQNELVSGQESRRWGNGHPNLVPYQLFRASDRHIVIAVGNDAKWLVCCDALELPALAEDARLLTNAGRLAHREEVVRQIQERVARRSAGEWLQRLGARGLPCGVVRTVSEAVRAVDASPVTGVAPVQGGAVRYAPPLLNEHGELIRQHEWGAFRLAPLLSQE